MDQGSSTSVLPFLNVSVLAWTPSNHSEWLSLGSKQSKGIYDRKTSSLVNDRGYSQDVAIAKLIEAVWNHFNFIQAMACEHELPMNITVEHLLFLCISCMISPWVYSPVRKIAITSIAYAMAIVTYSSVILFNSFLSVQVAVGGAPC